MGLVRRFSRPLTYFFGLCPVVLHGGALLLRCSVVGRIPSFPTTHPMNKLLLLTALGLFLAVHVAVALLIV